MKKQLFVMLAAFLLAGNLPAQEETPMVVVSSKGKIEYTSSDKSTKLKIAPGAVLQKSGSLKMGSGATAVIYCNGQFKTLQGPGVQSPSTLFVDQGSTRSLNFDGNFGLYIEEAVDLINYKSAVGTWGTIKKTGDGWGDAKPPKGGWGDAKPPKSGWGDAKPPTGGWGEAKPPTGGWGEAKPPKGGWGDAKPPKSGWGGQGNYIYPILPGGNVRPGLVKFSWSKPNNTAPYQLDIFDDANKVIHTQSVKDTFAVVDLGKLNLTPEQTYSWKASVPNNPDLYGEKAEFTVSTEEEYNRITRQLSNSKIYDASSPAVKALMEASTLEKAEWYYDAEQQYAKSLKNYPKDKLVRMMYAAFWVRGALEMKAWEVMNRL